MAKEGLCKVKPTLYPVSFQLPISCTNSNTHSVHEDSPLSVTIFPLLREDYVFASQIKTKELCRVKLKRQSISKQLFFFCKDEDLRRISFWVTLTLTGSTFCYPSLAKSDHQLGTETHYSFRNRL